MFGSLSIWEILIIGVALLLLFGPKRLPDLAKNMGKGIRDFKKALEGKDDDQKSLPKEVSENEPEKTPESTPTNEKS